VIDALDPRERGWQAPTFSLEEDLIGLEQVRALRDAVAVTVRGVRILRVLSREALRLAGLVPSTERGLHQDLNQLLDYEHVTRDAYRLFDRLRDLGNCATHARRRITQDDAEHAYGIALRSLQWFFCDFPHGPRLPSLLAHNQPLDPLVPNATDTLNPLLPRAVADLLRMLESADLDGRRFLAALKLERPDCPVLLSPVVAAAVVETLLDLKKTEEAEAVLTAALTRFPDDVRLRQLRGLSYSRTGRLEQACECLEAIEPGDAAADETTLGILAGVYKRRADAEPARRQEWIRACQDRYDRGWRCSGETNAYLGVNAAAVALWLGMTDQSKAVARKVRDLLLVRRGGLKAGGKGLNLWDQLTLAEVHLLLGEWDLAGQGYREAAERFPRQTYALAVAREQAARHLTALNVPPEIVGDPFAENALAEVGAYFDDLEAGASDDAELKVFLLGNGRVGKTQLARALGGLGYDESEPSTHGIRLHEHSLEVPDVPRPVRLTLWDFGGQDVYHGSHALFLQGQAVFLVLWDPVLETGEYREEGLTIRNHALPYWFDYLRAFAASPGEDGRAVVEGPVLLIQSRCESKRQEQDPPCLPPRDEFPNLYPLSFSARTGRNQAALTETLQEAVAGLFARRQPPPIGKGRVEVRDRIRAMQAAPEAERVRSLPREQFQKMCDQAGVSSAEALLAFLHHCGVVFHRPGLFGDRIVLDQPWALEAIYSLFHRRADLQAEFRVRGGRFTRELLDRFVWGKVREQQGLSPFSREDQALFLGMMLECHVAFRVGDDPEGEYAAPELLPAWSERHEVRFRHLLRQPPDASVTLRYDFWHEGIARTFLARLGAKAGQLAEYWKYGCWFHDATTQSEALIRCEQTPTADRPGAGQTSIRAWGPQARELARALAEVVYRLPIGQRPCPDPADRLDEPPAAQAPTSADALSREAGTPDNVKALPGPDPLGRLQPDHRPRTVFISYAHGPDAGALVRELVGVLRDNKTEVIWDEESLAQGESISEFVASVKTVPVLLAVLSARYPRSAYCVSELFAFFEACRCDPREFAARTLPLVLDDARIDSDLERAAHAEHWAQELARRESAAAKFQLDARQYALCQHAQTWKGQIANVLYVLADRKGSRGGAAIRAGGFESVLAALEGLYRCRGQ
jgi:internalin A